MGIFNLRFFFYKKGHDQNRDQLCFGLGKTLIKRESRGG